MLETFPRDELFQIGVEAAAASGCEGILDLETRPRVRVFARIDRFDRFVSLLVYVPRDRYTSTVRERIGALLAEAYNGRVAAFYPHFTDGPLVRVQFIVGRYAGATPQVDSGDLERGIAEIVRTWEDRLADAIAGIGRRRAERAARASIGTRLLRRATPRPSRRSGRCEDIKRIERLGPDRPVAIDFYREPGRAGDRMRAAVYRFGAPDAACPSACRCWRTSASRAIDERSYRVTPRFSDGTREVTLHDMVLETRRRRAIDLRTHDKRLEDAFLAVLHGDADNDGFNRLIVVGRRRLARGGHAAGLRRLSAPARLAVRPALPRRHARTAMPASRATCSSCSTCASIRTRKLGIKDARRRPRRRSASASKARWPPCRAWMRTASCGSS